MDQPKTLPYLIITIIKNTQKSKLGTHIPARLRIGVSKLISNSSINGTKFNLRSFESISSSSRNEF